ncbi:MAG: redoxin domain-containing protein [Anaerolineales bacterium]|nr:redoxin domain-containing protein [Anaerolineales bacterium]
MAQLRQDYKEFESLHCAIIVVGPEDAQSFANYMKENDLPFIGLPDPKHTVLKLYGQEIKLFKWGRMPSMLVIDKKGLVRFVHYGHNMSDIPDNHQVLTSLKNLTSH